MLEPRDRQLFFDALRPPVGYRFDQGIATTYSTDLVALMMAPVAFTFFDLHHGEDGPATSSLEVLEGLRRHADRLTLFCEAGRIAVPRGKFPQLAFVEDSVVQCRPPDGGAFHPKLWVIRLLGDGATRYRVLCMSRNLMFCRAWDTMLVLDGEVKGRTLAANHPLADFVRALPAMGDSVSPDVTARAELLSNELRSVQFELPAGVEQIRFWPLGHATARLNPFKELGKRVLVVSPFVGLTTLEALADGSTECTVVSTVPQLGALSRRPSGVSKFYVLNERAVAESDETQAAVSESMADAIALGDLHAKLYVTEFGAEAHVWTGSLNATDAALKRNVEFLVELVGHWKHLGIDTLMTAEKDSVRLINLVRDVTNEGLVAGQVVDEDVEALERRFDELRRALVDARFEAVATRRDDGSYDVLLVARGTGFDVGEGLEAACWPVSTDSRRTPFTTCAPGEALVSFPQLSFEALTTFFAFEVTGRAGGEERSLRFALNLPLNGVPEDRKQKVLRSFLTDRGRFMKFLMLLLADEGFDPGAFGDVLTEQRGQSEAAANAAAAGLLERLLHALDASPGRLDHLQSLLQQLTADPEVRDLLPPGFSEVWEPIWTVREARRHREAQP